MIEEGEPPSPTTPGASRRAGPEVAFQNARRYREIEERQLAGWTERLVGELAPRAASFTVRLTDDREVQELNRRYREVDRPTDALSFSGGMTPEGWHLGDVVIAVPVARQQAAERGESIGIELRHLVLHGLLHCLGHDHESDDGTMARLEAELRRRWIDDA